MKMKKILIVVLCVALAFGVVGCGSKGPSDEELAAQADELLAGKVKVPETYFKTQEEVEALYQAAGLEIKFVVSNFDERAEAREHYLRAGECDELDTSQPAITYFSYDEVGLDRAGPYADAGATIIVGYSDHDYDGTAGKSAEATHEESEEPEATESEIVDEDTTADPEPSEQVVSEIDVSDAAIESIETYNDYLAMYEMIILDYLINYEAVIKETALYDEAEFTQMKQDYEEAFEEQKDLYSDMGDAKLVGKETLVEFLTNYRDSLQDFIDNITTGLS